MNNQATQINSWSLLAFFMTFLKRNKAVIVSVFILPLVFIAILGANYKNIIVGQTNGFLTILILWLIQSSSFALQGFLAILLDLKQSIIFRRIGLTRIKKINFLIMASLFNMILMVISDIFILLVSVILLAAFHQTAFLNSIFAWQFALVVIITLVCLVLFTSIALVMAVFIKTRTGHTISSLIVTFLIMIPLFILIFFLREITNHNISIAITLAIFFGIFVGLILISVLLYYIARKYLKWYE